MASSASIAVGTVATVVASAGANPGGALCGWFTAVVPTGGSAVTFGGPNVAAGGPYSVAAGGTLSAFLFPGDQVFAVAGAAVTVSVLQTGQ